MRVIRVRYQEKVFYAALLQKENEQGEIALEVQCLNKDIGLTEPIPIQNVSILPAVVPTKIICVGLNYRLHAEETGMDAPDEPVLFLKPPSAVIGNGQTIILPPQSARVDYEGELVIILGKTSRNTPVEEVGHHIFGYACGNDVTARDLQKKDGQFGRAKGFDTFAPIGPWIETQVRDPNDLRLITTVNGEIKQQSSTADMLFSPFELVSFISSVMTLHPGDVIFTGTPAGIGPLSPGDEVRVEIAEVGALINSVAASVGHGMEQSPIQ
jgi:2-keto-4-pentenoate hydratase/2-oxohepta-3-ene-1,7-dioic acid hydratase in catechol pathway